LTLSILNSPLINSCHSTSWLRRI